MSFVMKIGAAIASSVALAGLTLWYFASWETAHFEHDKKRRTGIFAPAIIILAGLTGWLWFGVLRSPEFEPSAAATLFAFAYFLVGVPTVSMWRDAHRARLKRESAELDQFARWVHHGSGPADPELKEQTPMERETRAELGRTKNQG